MFKLQSVFLLVTAILFSYVQCNKLCDLSDSMCLTKAANKVYKSLVSGIDGLTNPLDPIHQDKVTAELPTLKYEITNATLTGLKTCVINSLEINKDELTFHQIMECPELVINADYSVGGTVDSVDIKTQGAIVMTLDNTIIIFKGKVGQLFGEDDKKLRLYMLSNDIKTIIKEPFRIEIRTTVKEDQEKGDLLTKYHSDNTENTKKILELVMDFFSKMFSHELNTFLKGTPIENIIIF